MAPVSKPRQSKVTFDAGTLLIEALKSIGRDTGNPHIDDQINQIASVLEQSGIQRRGWLGQLLYQYRGLQGDVPSDYDLFLANVGVAQASGALGPRAASALRGMAERTRAVKPRPRVERSKTVSKEKPKETQEPSEGMVQWKLAGDFEQALHVIEKRPSEATVKEQYAQLEGELAGTPFATNLYFALYNFMRCVLGDDEDVFGYFTDNMANAPRALGRGGTNQSIAYARKVWAKHNVITTTVLPTEAGAVLPRVKRENLVRNKPTEAKTEEKVLTPQLDQAIEIADRLTKMPLPEGVKSGIEGIKSSLELARASKQNARGGEYPKHIAALASAVFKTVGEIVKHAGQNVELAGQACEQLGKIAKLFGGVAKSLSALDNAMRVLRGTTLGGTKVSTSERVDAAIDLITTFAGTVGFAAAISLAEYKWCWNTIGVPILQATEQAGEADLRYVFGGKEPEKLKAEIQALRTDPQFASATIRRIYGSTFTRSSLYNTGYSAMEQWEKFRNQRIGMYRAEIDAIYAEDRWTSGRRPTISSSRTPIADELKAAAIAFIDREVAKVRAQRVRPQE